MYWLVTGISVTRVAHIGHTGLSPGAVGPTFADESTCARGNSSPAAAGPLLQIGLAMFPVVLAYMPTCF